MKRYFLRIAVFAGVVIVGWIAIAQAAQRQTNEAVVLPPPPTSRMAESHQVPTDLEARGNRNENPLRDGQVATATPPETRAMASPQTTPQQSFTSDPFWANSIPAASDQREPVRAYNVEPNVRRPGERIPVRTAGYGGSPENTLAEPTMVPSQPSLENEVANDNFPTAQKVNQPADPANRSTYDPRYSNDLAYDNQSQNNYLRRNELAQGHAVLSEGPSDPSPAPLQKPYGAPQDLRETPNRYAARPQDRLQPLDTEPARLPVPEEERQLAPINNRNNYDPSRSSYGSVSNSNLNRDFGSGYSGTGDSGYTNHSSQNASLRDDSYPMIDPVGAAPMESNGPTGVGQPARNRNWDGEQLPQLRVVKVAPKEIQVGKPAVFRVEIENVGRVTAHGVEVRDQIPQSTRLILTKPESVTDSRGGLVWQLGEMKPGDKAVVEMKLMPTAEGDEIGSVAMVRFGTPASVRTVATRPMLEVEVITEDRVMVESETMLTIRVSNPGSGVATGVVLEERIPQGLQHAAGAELRYEIGRLAPKASKTIQLKLSAIRSGIAKNILIAKADGLKEVVRESDIEVVAPVLQIAMKGPRARYLNRKALYEVEISNPGSATARDVRLVATLPPGLKFVEANNNGHYDPGSRTVRWALAELPVNETGTVRLTALPVEMGDHAVKIQGTADRAVAVKEEQRIKVDGIAALRFEVVDVNDPVEVGAETAYEIRVLNQGTKDASNVAIQVTLPPSFELISAEGPGSLRSTQQNGQIIFEPIRRLAPKVDTTFRIRVRGRQAGDHRLRVALNSDDLRSPVIKEESTRVFGDK